MSNDTRTSSGQVSVSPIDGLGKDGSSDVSGLIREQLKLLKMGKCDNTLFAPKTPTNTAPTSRRTTICLSKRPSFTEKRKSIDATIASPSNSQKMQQSQENQCSDPENAEQSIGIGGMIDSLFIKLQTISKLDETDEIMPSEEKPPETNAPTDEVAMQTKLCEVVSESANNDIATTSTDNSNQITDNLDAAPVEMLGFDISNRGVDVSALLPTPKVTAQSSKAAFISEDLDTFMKENALDSLGTFEPKKVCLSDEALVTSDSEPPAIAIPDRPVSTQRHRTLAQKRMHLQKPGEVNMSIVENESAIFRELKQRIRTGLNYDPTSIRRVQDVDVPFTRDCWRAVSWMATSNERYFYQTVKYGSEEFKLTGTRGNNAVKVAFELPNDENRTFNERHTMQKSGNCDAICTPIPKITKINNLAAFLKEREKKTNSESDNRSIDIPIKSRMNMFARRILPPGPRSEKLKLKLKSRRSSSFDLDYGPLEILPLPRVQFEAWPCVGVVMPDNLKPLMRIMWSDSDVITPDRALFATSVLRQPVRVDKKTVKYIRPKPRPFIFDIPYENNEKTILIRRRRRKAKRDSPIVDRMAAFYADNKPLTFTQNVDPTDALGIECSNILSDMIDTVAISINEEKFTKYDPDIDYIGKYLPVVPGQKETKPKATRSKRDDPAKSKLLYVYGILCEKHSLGIVFVFSTFLCVSNITWFCTFSQK